MNELENAIKSMIDLSNLSSTGFYQQKCKVCKDHTVRAGFKFEHDGVIYQCFRGKCDGTVVQKYDEPLSKKFRRVMDAYNVTIPNSFKFKKNRVQKAPEEYDQSLFEKNDYEAIKMNKTFKPITDAPEHDPFYFYLEDRSLLDHKDKFLCCTFGFYDDCLIIPFYFYGKLIGWQALHIYTGTYRTHGSHMIYLPNGRIPDEPIITDSAIDAMCVPNGVGILKSEIDKKQAYHLRHTKPYVLPDKKGGERSVAFAKRYGWGLIIPTYKVKDANEAKELFGKMVVAKMMAENKYEDSVKAEVKYRIWKD